MISVTHLCSYLYCPRKLYLNLVLGLQEKAKEITIKGQIKHSVYEIAKKNEKEVIIGLNKGKKYEEFEMDFRRLYNKILMLIISQNKKEIEELNFKSLDVYKELWPFFLLECTKRSKEVYDFAISKDVYGEELWMSLPKGIPELIVCSEKLGLKGRIDNVEILDGEFIPVEIKTGRAPNNGAWDGHKIQIGAYILLLSEHYGKEIKYGFIDYKEGGRIKITMNPFLKDEIMEIKEKVKDILNKKEIPDAMENKKCESCGLAEECRKIYK